MTGSEGYRFREPLNTPEFRGARPRNYSRIIEAGMLIERDVEIPTRFGYVLYADVFRPLDETAPVPPLLAWTPYGKHDPAPLAVIYPDSGVAQDWCSHYTIFEAPDPAYWVPRGYAIVLIDVPGTWYASTEALYCAPEEAEAFADAIEWAGVQPWSNGNVGLSGVSYLAVMQWRVAELNPPHLAAINPWEGWSDTYREVVRHGGIPDTFFWPYIQVRWGASDHRIEDLWAESEEHQFFDDFWASKASSLEAIRVPAYVVASWSDQGLHTRGTLEGFKKISSERKWLEIHGRKKWAHYYDPDSVERQRAFFDHFLKGADTEITSWPPVRYEVRDAFGKATSKTAQTWPLEHTDYRRLYLDAASGRLTTTAPAQMASTTYDPLAADDQAVFELRFDEPTELVGHMKLHAFVTTDAGDDLDLFVAVQKLDSAGRHVGFAHYGVFETGPVALGWLRVSHRELDPSASTEHQPVLTHAQEHKTNPGEVVEVDVEILPSGTAFAVGETLRLLIKGRDIYPYGKPAIYPRHENTVNRGLHTLFTGGHRPSYLLLPAL